MRDDEPVDHVEVGRVAAVHARDDAVLDDELGLGIIRPVRRHEPELGKRRDELLEWRSRVARDAKRAARHGQQPAIGVRGAASRTNAAVFDAPKPSSRTAHSSSSSAVARPGRSAV